MAAESLINHAATGILEIVWQDGTRQQLSHAHLRHICQCADCKSARCAATGAPSVPGDVRIVEILPVGAYAVQLIFSDGHLRGIFPWTYLKRLATTQMS